MKTKWKWWWWSAGLFFFPFLLAFYENDDPTESAAFEVRDYVSRGITDFEEHLKELKTHVLNKDTATARKVFLQTRIAYKRIEFFIEGTESERVRGINGPPVPYMEYIPGITNVIHPQGLQVLEELLFDEVDWLDAETQCNELLYEMMLMSMIVSGNPVSNAMIFQMARYNLIRIETLGVVGFDCAITKNIFPEISANLTTIDTIASIYLKHHTHPEVVAHLQKVRSTCREAVKKLSKERDFDAFDRLSFIRTFLHPLNEHLIQAFNIIKANQPVLVRVFKYPRAVNLEIPNIYDARFLNPLAYAEKGYYRINQGEKVMPEMVDLGKRLFFDNRLSADMKMSCGTCHQPEMAFTDGRKRSITNVEGRLQARNTPTIIYANLQDRYFYDLRAKSLEEQVAHVFMNKEEFNISYTEVVNRLKQDSGYVQAFRKIFAEEAPHTINEWTINKALAAFVREQGKFDSEFDRYMTGKQKEIAPEVKRGFNLFMGKAKCGTCHFAPTFYGTTPPFYMESESEVLGILEKWDTLHPVLSADSGRYHFQKNEVYIRSLKTSTVRNIALTAPYMHNGGFPNLESVLDFYNRGGGAGMGLEVSNQTLSAEALNLSQQEISDIIAFMKSLTDKELENLAKGN